MKTSDDCYLDYAAATPLAEHVLAAMMPYFSQRFFNPSSPYAPAVAVRHDYEAAKAALAQTFGAKGDELVMTAGATESINLAFHQTSGHVVTSSIEHPAVLEAAKIRAHTLVAPSEKGIIQPEALDTAITPSTELVSISLVNSELGTLQPIRKIAQIVTAHRQKRAEEGNMTPLLFHCDASQGFGQIDVHVARLGVDLLTLNAGKIYGPKQVGLLWLKSSVDVVPSIVGGGQERGLRSGTENVPGVIGFAKAAEWVMGHQQAEVKRLQGLRHSLQKKLVDAFPDAEVLGHPKQRLPGHLSIAFPNIDAERVIFLLENKQVYVATGSACAANKHTASHVLTALGLDESLINGSLRISLGHFTDETQIERAATAIIEAVSGEYSRMEKHV